MYEQEGIRSHGKTILANREWQKIMGRSDQATRNLTGAALAIMAFLATIIYLVSGIAFAQEL